jgi:hypothetical protein
LASHQHSEYHISRQLNHSHHKHDTEEGSEQDTFSYPLVLSAGLLRELYQSFNSFDRFWPLMGADIDLSVLSLRSLPCYPNEGGIYPIKSPTPIYALIVITPTGYQITPIQSMSAHHVSLLWHQHDATRCARHWNLGQIAGLGIVFVPSTDPTSHVRGTAVTAPPVHHSFEFRTKIRVTNWVLHRLSHHNDGMMWVWWSTYTKK